MRTTRFGFCATAATILALPKAFAARIAAAVESAEKPTLVWLEFQDCAGNTESFLRASRPTVAQIILDTLSIDYHETIMAAAGHQAESNLANAVASKRGQYIAVVEGSIPTGADGAYCTIGGKAALQIAREVCGGAAATIAIGTCATFGGLPAAAPNPTAALGVGDAVPNVKNLINLSACPANADNLTALIVYYLTFKSWPPLDHYRRPLFAYGKSIHANCVTVLIRGESGTGKELVANALHYRSPRRGKPLIKMNCAALSRELVESELFGHERGAFTGAIARREGKFEAADGGTLFLDEVGDMPLETQAKLLRALQEREFERVGGNDTIKVDVRVLAATNQDLETAVRNGRFREDLYYRLRVVELTIPPLAERREDIPLLIEHFLQQAAERFNRPPKPLTSDALRACVEHVWKGNVRELRSAVEQALLLAPGTEIDVADLVQAAAQPAAAGVPASRSFREAKAAVVETFEREFLATALRRHGGNISKAAEEIGMYRQNLQQKIKELGISAEETADETE